jgi:mono/diheme cytochrome c family protein
MPNPADTTASLESRAKAYLDINCAVCHQPNGPTPTNMDLRYVTSLAGMNILGVPSTQSSGTRLVGGSHSSSDLWVRASSTGTNRMPPLGVQLIDTQALEMLAAWIDGIQ